MNSNITKLIKFLVFTSIAVALMYFVFKDVDLYQMWADIKQANFYWVGVSLVFALIGYVSRAIRWNYLLQPLGYKASFKNRFLAVVFGYFANFAFPRIGEVARCGALSRKENIPVDKLLGTVIVERVIDLFMLILIGTITFFLKIDLFGAFISEKIIGPMATSIQDVNILYLIIVGGIIGIGLYSIAKLRHKNKFAKKITQFISGVLLGLKSVYTMKDRWFFIFHTLLIWVSYWAMTYFVFFSIPQTSNLDMADGLFILIVGGLGMSVPVQGGMGAFHYFVSHALAIFGLDQKTDGVLFATISHESQTIMVIVMGIISVIMLSMNKKNKHESR